MTVTITPRNHPKRQDVYGGIKHVYCNGTTWYLYRRLGPMDWFIDGEVAEDHGRTRIPFADVAALALDDDGGIE